MIILRFAGRASLNIRYSDFTEYDTAAEPISRLHEIFRLSAHRCSFSGLMRCALSPSIPDIVSLVKEVG